MKDTESRVELTVEAEKEEETEGKSGFGEGVTQPSAPKLSKTDSASVGNGKRKKKKKGIRLTKKPVKNKGRGQMGKGKGAGKKKFKSSNRKTEVANSKLSPEISAALQQQQRPNSRKVVASIEDILPDLKPTRPVTTPRMMTKRLSSETAKAAQIVRAVTTAEDVFTCLECGQTFEDYVSLNSHKAICNLHKEKRKRVGMVAPGMKYKDDSGPRVAKSATYNEEDYSNFISKAIRQVCEIEKRTGHDKFVTDTFIFFTRSLRTRSTTCTGASATWTRWTASTCARGAAPRWAPSRRCG